MWAVIYGGVHDGTALHVENDVSEIHLPKLFDIKKHGHEGRYPDGEFAYERSTARATGWNVSGVKQEGIAFTPKVLEAMG